MNNNKLPLSRSLLWILVSTLLISGSAFMAWQYHLHMRERRLHDDQFRLIKIVQNTFGMDALKTAYLAELLGLSIDKKINLYQFNVKKGEEQLLASPMIKQAAIKKILPETIHIDYQLRQPFALLGNYANAALDEEGYLFPLNPFYSPKNLTTIYFADQAEKKETWGACFKEDPSFKLAMSIIQNFQRYPFEQMNLKEVDVSTAWVDRTGKRQILIWLKELKQEASQCDIFLRLNVNNYRQNLANFHTLYVNSNHDLKVAEKWILIDFRIPHLAYLRKDE